jgi:hypothetical protein
VSFFYLQLQGLVTTKQAENGKLSWTDVGQWCFSIGPTLSIGFSAYCLASACNQTGSIPMCTVAKYKQ